MLQSKIFTGSGMGMYTARRSTNLLTQAVSEATAWINEQGVEVLHLSVCEDQMAAHVVVWYRETDLE